MPTVPTLDNTPSPRQAGYDASLGELLVRFAVGPERQLRIESASDQAQRIQTQQTSEDYLPEFGDVTSRNNFTGGEGLDFAYRSDAGETDSRRFWDSEGIDISVTRPGLLDGVTLLPATEVSWSSTEPVLPAGRTTDGVLYYGDANTVYEVPNPESASPTRNAEDPDAGGSNDVLDLTTLGDEVYAALGAGKIAKRASGGGWSVLGSAPTTVGIWGVKGRIIADDGAGLVAEIDTSTGSPTTLINLASTVMVNAVIDAGPVILVAASDGQIYSFADNSGTLELGAQNTITNVDVPTTMVQVAGTLILGTWDGNFGRIWRAQVGDANSGFAITGASLLKELTYEPTASAAARDAAYIGVRRSATEVELWRYDLASTGLSRDLVATASSAGSIDDVVSVGGRRYISIAGNGVSRTADTYVDDGYLITPMADFFSPAEKVWMDITVQATQITSEASIDIFVSTDPAALLDPADLSWQLIGRISDPGQVGTPLLLPNIEGRYAGAQFRLNSGNAGADTPRLMSYALRAYTDSDDVIVQMPVNVSDWIERPRRRPFRVPDWGETVYAAVNGFRGHAVDLQIYEPELQLRGVVEAVSLPVNAIYARGSSTLYCLVQFRGRILLAETTFAGEGPLGVELAGVHLAGT
jgi:hypothetical protein